MYKFHIIKVTAVPATETKPAKVRIYSELWGKALIVPFSEVDAITTAESYLKSTGFNILGSGEGQLNKSNIKETFIVTDTFDKLPRP